MTSIAQPKTREEIDNLLKILLDKIVSLLKNMNALREKEVERDRIRSVILEPKMLTQRSKKWQNLATIIFIVEQLETNPLLFTSKKQEHEKTLQELGESEIADAIRKIEITKPWLLNVAKDALRLLIIYERESRKDDLNSIIARTKQLKDAISKFKERLLQDEDKGVDAIKLIEVLDAVMKIAEENELLYVSAYLNDLKAANSYLPRGINFFSERIRHYLYGTANSATINNIPIIGLISAFKDTETEKEITKSDKVKQLTTFREQVIFYGIIYVLIKKDETQKDWIGKATKDELLNRLRGFWMQGNITAEELDVVLNKMFGKYTKGNEVDMPFLGISGFFHNLDIGENYINLVERHFGNKSLAAQLKNVKDKAGMQPKVFEAEFRMLERTLLDPTRQSQIIAEAIQEIENIFKRKAAKLSEEAKSKVKAQASKIADIIRGISDAHEKSLRELRKLIINKKLRLYKEWKHIIAKYSEIEKALVDEVEECTRISYEAIHSVDTKALEQRLIRNSRATLANAEILGVVADNIRLSSYDFEELSDMHNTLASAMFFQAQYEESARDNIRIFDEMAEIAPALIPLVEEQSARAIVLVSRYKEIDEIVAKVKQTLEIIDDDKEAPQSKVIDLQQKRGAQENGIDNNGSKNNIPNNAQLNKAA